MDFEWVCLQYTTISWVDWLTLSWISVHLLYAWMIHYIDDRLINSCNEHISRHLFCFQRKQSGSMLVKLQYKQELLNTKFKWERVLFDYTNPLSWYLSDLLCNILLMKIHFVSNHHSLLQVIALDWCLSITNKFWWIRNVFFPIYFLLV